MAMLSSNRNPLSCLLIRFLCSLFTVISNQPGGDVTRSNIGVPFTIDCLTSRKSSDHAVLKAFVVHRLNALNPCRFTMFSTTVVRCLFLVVLYSERRSPDYWDQPGMYFWLYALGVLVLTDLMMRFIASPMLLISFDICIIVFSMLCLKTFTVSLLEVLPGVIRRWASG